VRLLLDADAFLCLRSNSLLDLLLAAKVPLVMTGYVARHELASLQASIQEMERRSSLKVEDVRAKTPEFIRYRQFLREGAHKGEAESVAWAVEKTTRDTRPVFVSLDGGARKLAASNGMVSLDVFDLMVLAVREGLCTAEEVRTRLAAWDDDPHGFCRPPDFTSFDETWRKRARSQGRG